MYDQADKYTDAIRKSLKRIAQANDIHLSNIQETIEFVHNRIESIRRVNWQAGDLLEEELTKAVCHAK